MGTFDFMFKKEVRDKQPASPPPTNKITITQPIQNFPTGSSKIDYVAIFEKLVEEANIPGLDYYEFSLALRKKDGLPLSEEQKYKDIWDVLQAATTIPNVLDSGEKYIQICLNKDGEFNKTLAQDILVGVTQKRSKAKAYQAEVDDMKKSILAKEAEIQTLLTDATTNENTLNIEKNAFTIALNNKVAFIRNHLTNIKNFLNGTN